MKKKYYLLILLSLGLLTRFVFFGYPSETVFDEVHFGKFISGYYTREFFFDIHPPLGKLMIAGFAKLFDFQPGFAFAEIGNKYPDNQYMLLRFLPSLAGALLPILIFLLLLELGLSSRNSFFGGLLIVLENALLVQSRYILLDSFLLLFGFLAVLFYFKFRKSDHNSHLILFGLFSGLTISVKWTGLSFLALPLIFEFIKIFKNKEYIKTIKKLVIPLAIAIIVYFLIFLTHIIILNKTGAGDAFMSAGFQKTLIGSSHSDDQVKSTNIFQKFTELNIQMYQANQRLDASHPYSSAWYSWPFMSRTIYYWVNTDARIYLIGNPIIWWGSSAAILFSIILVAGEILKTRNARIKENNFLIYFLLGSYIINMLPFVGISRVMFLYHYFPAYIFAIIMMIWLISQNKNSKMIFGIFLLISIASFFYFSPLNYGLELSTKSYESKVWFESWR